MESTKTPTVHARRLERVRNLAARYQAAEAVSSEAMAALQREITAAYEAGVRKEDLVRASGLARGTVYRVAR